MNEDASQESVSHDNVQDTCTSSDSEEQEMSVTKGGDPLEKTSPEPEKCQALALAGELETEKSEGDNTEVAVREADKDCVGQNIPDSLQVETSGKTKYTSTC